MVRRVIAIVLAVLASIMIGVSAFAVWSKNTVLKTDKFSADIEQALNDERFQEALIDYLTTEIVGVLDVGNRIRDLLPIGGNVLAIPVAEATEEFVHNRITDLVDADWFIPTLVDVIEVAHRSAIALIEGREGDVLNVNNGTVVIDFAPLLRGVLERLGADGIVERLANLDLPDDFGQVTVLQSDTLDEIQTIFDVASRYLTLLLVTALVLTVGAILISPGRRRTIIHLGVGTAVTLVALWLLFRWIGSRVTDLVAERRNQPDAPAADVVVEVLRDSLRTVVLVGAIIAFIVVAVAWFTGPGLAPTALRARLSRLLIGPKGLAILVSRHAMVAWVTIAMISLAIALQTGHLLIGLIAFVLLGVALFTLGRVSPDAAHPKPPVPG